MQRAPPRLRGTARSSCARRTAGAAAMPDRRARRRATESGLPRGSRRAPRRRARRDRACRSGGLRRFFLFRLRSGFLGLLGGFLLLIFFGLGLGRVFRTVHERDQRERRVVALAEAGLEDAQVAAIALGVARAEVVEQLLHDRAVAQPVESEPAVGERGLLAERDHRLHHAPQLLGLWHGG